MDLNRLRMMLAAPMASLFMVLILCLFAVRTPGPSVGIRIPVIRLRTAPTQFTCDGRFVFVQLLADGSTRINTDDIAPDQLAPKIAEIMQYRAERVVYLIAAPEVPYRRFVDAIDEMSGATADLHIAVLTQQIWNTYRQQSLEPCQIVWP